MERLCGLECHGPVTDVSSRYVEIMEVVRGLRGHYVMGPEAISKLRADIPIFLIEALSLFGNMYRSN